MARRPQPPEAPRKDDFIVLFTALSMILLAFFIMLNSMATVDAARSRAVVSSLVGTFGSMPGFEPQRRVLELEHELPPSRKAGHIESAVKEVLQGEAEDFEVFTDDGRVVVSVGEAVFFESGDVSISPRSFRSLNTLAELIKRLDVQIRIEGHADAQRANPPRSNWYYSAARSAALYRYFVDGGGVPEEKVGLAAYANHRPDRHGQIRARVEVIFLPGRPR